MRLQDFFPEATERARIESQLIKWPPHQQDEFDDAGNNDVTRESLPRLLDAGESPDGCILLAHFARVDSTGIAEHCMHLEINSMT